MIDEEYYKVNGDEEYIQYRKIENPDFYPYRNSVCEVDWYRFRPVLNNIGESFMTIDKFLNEGEMYKIRF